MSPDDPRPGSEGSDDRTAFSKAAAWTYHVLAICLGMAVPGAVGYGIDYWLGTRAVFLILGVTLGTVYGIWRLIAVSKSMNRR